MIGERIKCARLAVGLSLRALAKKTDISHAAIKKYEDGQTIPSSTRLLQLSKALGIKVEYFLRPNTLQDCKVKWFSHGKLICTLKYIK